MGSQGFRVKTCVLRQKVPSASVGPRLMCSRQYKLFSQRLLFTAVPDCSGSECCTLPSYIYIKFYFAIIITRSLSSLDAF